MLTENSLAPEFTQPAVRVESSGAITQKSLSLLEFRGQFLLLYFYPKDQTSGCTKQACDFQARLPDFSKLNAAVVGVSRDSLASHEKFLSKEQLRFWLIADEDGAVCNAYGVWVEKSMYGRKYMGIERTSFLIDPKGKVIKQWNKVKVPGHGEAVIAALEAANQK